MKTNVALTGLLMLLFSACKSPGYLPSSDKIGISEYGSYIKIIPKTKTSDNIYGELIAIDSTKIVVLTDKINKCVTVPIHDVNRFSLRYARSKHYGWTIPLFVVLPFIHGIYSVFTMPLHLIVTISVTASGENAFKYSNKNMTYGKLRMFARFPQGIPPNIDLASIQ